MLSIKRTGKLKAIGIAAGTVGIFFAAQLLVSFIFTIAEMANIYNVADLYGRVMESATLISILADLLAVAVILIIHACRRKPPLREAEIHKAPASHVLLGVALGVLSLITVTGVLYLIPENAIVMEEYEEASSSLGQGPFWQSFLATVVVAPVAEEILFRGTILKYMRRAFHPALAVILSSLIFGVLHGQLIWIAYATSIGIVLGIVYVKTNSILPTIALHVTFNLLGGFSFDAEVPEFVFALIAAAAAAGLVLILILCFREKPYRYRSELIGEQIPAETPVIDVRNMSAGRGPNCLRNVDLRVFRGDGLGLRGDLRDTMALIGVLSGSMPYQKGSVRIGGHELEQQQGPLIGHMAMLTPMRTYMQGSTARSNFALYWRPQEALAMQETMERLFRRYGVSEFADLPVESLSPAQLTLMSLVLSIARDQEIVFFADDGQIRDAQTASLVKMILGDLRAREKTVVIASLHENLIRQYCTKQAVVQNGAVLMYGRSAEIDSVLLRTDNFGGTDKNGQSYPRPTMEY